MRAAAAMLTAALGLSGCAVTYQTMTSYPSAGSALQAPKSTSSLEIHPFSKAGEEVQTCAFVSVGAWYSTSDPTANGAPTLNARYLKAQITRVPAFREGTNVPSVTATTKVDAQTGLHVEDSLEVGTYLNEPEEAADAETSEGDQP